MFVLTFKWSTILAQRVLVIGTACIIVVRRLRQQLASLHFQLQQIDCFYADDEVDPFRWSGRTPSGVGIRISALERKPRKRLGIFIHTHSSGYELDGKSLDGRTFGARQING